MNLDANGVRTGEIARKDGRIWGRDELMLALDLYHDSDCLHDASDSSVRELSRILGRTPASVALKLANFKSIDPERPGGMNHFGSRDVEVWNEFKGRIDVLCKEAEVVLERLNDQRKPARQALLSLHDESTENRDFFVPDNVSERKVRISQAQFRAKVLDAYENQCALCEVDIKELLIASHIVPWSEDKENRLNPRNGIALCALHDRAFDRDLLTFEDDGKVVLSQFPRLSPSLVRLLKGSGRLRTPLRNPPDPEFLEYRRLKVARVNAKERRRSSASSPH